LAVAGQQFTSEDCEPQASVIDDDHVERGRIGLTKGSPPALCPAARRSGRASVTYKSPLFSGPSC
jgi:hypothetical protein